MAKVVSVRGGGPRCPDKAGPGNSLLLRYRSPAVGDHVAFGAKRGWRCWRHPTPTPMPFRNSPMSDRLSRLIGAARSPCSRFTRLGQPAVAATRDLGWSVKLAINAPRRPCPGPSA